MHILEVVILAYPQPRERFIVDCHDFQSPVPKCRMDRSE